MASTGTEIPEAPSGVEEDFPRKPNDREELHAYVKTGNSLWWVWAIVAFVLVAFVYLWWGFYAARPTSVPQTPNEGTAPPPLH